MLFSVETSIFAEAAVGEAMVSRYRLPRRTQCRLFTRSQSDLYCLDTGRRRYFLKVYPHGRMRVEIQAEVELLRHLAASGLNVAVPITDSEGHDLQMLRDGRGSRCAVLFAEVAGEAKGPASTDLSIAEMRAFGRAAAQMHAACDALPVRLARPQLDVTTLIEAPMRRLRPHLRANPKVWQDLQVTAASLANELRALGRKAPVHGLCHGDLHFGNLRWQSGAPTLFDFDSCGYGWRAYDLAKPRRLMLWRPKTQRARQADQRRWEAFLAGYDRERGLEPSELAAINVFIPVHHLWWLGLRLQLGPCLGWQDLDEEFCIRQVARLNEWWP